MILPVEIWVKIFSYISLDQAFNLCFINKYFHKAFDESKQYWFYEVSDYKLKCFEQCLDISKYINKLSVDQETTITNDIISELTKLTSLYVKSIHLVMKADTLLNLTNLINLAIPHNDVNQFKF